MTNFETLIIFKRIKLYICTTKPLKQISMQPETPNTETTKVQSYMEFVIEFINDEHFQRLEEKTKQKYFAKFNSNMEDQLKNEYNKGFFAGTMEGMQKMADALNNSRK